MTQPTLNEEETTAKSGKKTKNELGRLNNEPINQSSDVKAMPNVE